MPEIAGYTDRQYIKGQYYRLAAAPKPVVFTGNIDTVSEELLTKAMFVSKNQSGGTFPNDFGTNFLITTVKYGNDTYLQTAYLVQEEYNCYEYRRIYSNASWTEWVGVDSEIDVIDDKIQDVKDTADGAVASINSINGQVSNLASSVNGLNNSVGSLAGQINSVGNRVSTVESRTVNCGKLPLNLWRGTLSSGEIKLSSCYGRHSQFLIVAKVQNKSDASLVTQTILKPQLTTSNVSYCISDEIYYLSYYIRYSGDDVYVTFRGQNRNGYIAEVWGIY